MATPYWIKLYIEILHDPKMGVLSDRLWRRTIEIFLIAGDYNQKGKLPSLDHMAWMLRMSAEPLESDLVELQKKKIVDYIDGDWYVVNFADRQRKRTSTERVRRYRERQRREEYGSFDKFLEDELEREKSG